MEADWKEKSDEEILKLWQDNDRHDQAGEWAAELLQRYRLKVYVWCGRYVFDPDRALDLTQDILLSAYQNLGRIPRGARFAAWLFVVTRNACLGELRKMKVRQVDASALDSLVDQGNTPEEELLRNLAEKQFLDLLDTTLTPIERKAINLRCFEKMPVDTITEVLQITSASGARGVLQQARRKLKSALEGRPK